MDDKRKEPRGADTTKIQLVKTAPPPSELPVFGSDDPSRICFIGRTNYVAALEEKKFIFGIRRDDRKKHVYVLGKSGVGKSKLFEILMRQDIAYGYGAAIIDPSGDTIEDMLSAIPQNRAEDVIIFDPSDTERPICFNPFADVPEMFRHQMAQAFVEIMASQFGASWSARLEHVVRFAALALLCHNGSTVRSILPLLTDAVFRKQVIEDITDEMVRKFWEEEFPIWQDKYESDAILPLVTKLGQFFSDPLMKSIFSSHENHLVIPDIISAKKILFVHLKKGLMGDANSNFLGSMLLAKFKEAGVARMSQSSASKQDYYLYIDEFTPLVTEMFQSLLTEGKKYGFCLTLSHQYATQLSATALASLLGNVATIITFRASGDDAQKIKSEMTPTFEVKDITNLGTRQFYIKMTIDGETMDPFSAETLKVHPMQGTGSREQVLEASRRFAHSQKSCKEE